MSVTSSKLFCFVDGSLERILKKVLPCRYPLQPIFVEKAIEKAITENTKVFKNGVLPPNRIIVFMNKGKAFNGFIVRLLLNDLKIYRS